MRIVLFIKPQFKEAPWETPHKLSTLISLVFLLSLSMSYCFSPRIRTFQISNTCIVKGYLERPPILVERIVTILTH